MKRIHNISIRRKITMIVMTISTVSLLLASIAFIVNDRVNTRDSAEEVLYTISGIIGANTSHAMLDKDSTAAKKALKYLAHAQHIMAAAIYTLDGVEFAVYKRSHHQDALPLPDGRIGKFRYHDNYVDLFFRLSHQYEPVGYLYLRSDMGIINEHLTWYLRITGIVFLGSLLIAFILSGQLQRIITDPLLRLSEIARQITTEKNYALRVVGMSADEIGSLIRDFNEMLDQIQYRDDELELHKSKLEQRVTQRTTELESTNLELENARQKAESVARSMKYHAHHDSLTGLPNRTLLNDRIRTALSHAHRDQSTLALLFLDLDRFKIINDSLGHAVGDQLLRIVARRLSNCVREEDTVARLGGDEFMVLLPSISGSSDAGRIGRKITEALIEPASCHGHELHITTSIGVSIFPFDGTDAETLVKHADIGMYCAKDLGRNKLVYYTAEMNAESHKQLALENNLRKALGNDQLKLMYQPKIDIPSNSIVGAEALLRWEHPTMGVVSPLDFIPVAEDSGLIVPIGEWVLNNAFLQLRELHDAGYTGLTMAINLSSAQLTRSGLVKAVRDSLESAQLDAHMVELEITEHSVMQNIDSAIATLTTLTNMGVSIAMDDFGTGYSSLSHLRKLPIDTVKIDHSFARELPDNQEDVSIARAIIAMAQSLNLTLIAEGVENIKQLNFFRQQGVNIVQGYLFSKPVSGEELKQMLNAQSTPGPVNLVR